MPSLAWNDTVSMAQLLKHTSLFRLTMRRCRLVESLEQSFADSSTAVAYFKGQYLGNLSIPEPVSVRLDAALVSSSRLTPHSATVVNIRAEQLTRATM